MSEFIYTVEEIFDSSTMKGCLTQHGCSAFRIPSYQRGYKWGSETNQPVERLLSDLIKAWKAGAKEYLLQAITVKKNSSGNKNYFLEVIDGQQRLTTLFILLYVLERQIEPEVFGKTIAADKLLYSIRHEQQSLDDLIKNCVDTTKEKAIPFEELKEKQRVEEETQQDVYYLKCAFFRCVCELDSISVENNGGHDKLNGLKNFVLTKTKLLVNAVEPHIRGEDIFCNLNSNRVFLTETELIKGLLLTRVARESATARPRQYREILEKRIHLGRKWDEISRWANQPNIRSLYFTAFKNSGDDHMHDILELVALQMKNSYEQTSKGSVAENPLFEYFLEQGEQGRWEPIFLLLNNTYATLDEWYECTEDYHLLGYCLVEKNETEQKVLLKDLLGKSTKVEVRKCLLEQRNEIIKSDSEKQILAYGEDNQRIKSILLALSVFRGREIGGRFDFFAYQHEDWSLEHIFPQTPFGKEAKLTHEQEKTAFDVLINNEGNILSEEERKNIEIARASQENAETMMAKVNEILIKVPLLHQLGNLCLLSRKDNTAMGCLMFDDKRKVIRDRIARGSFVPSHTYEVFSKMIVGKDTSLQVWSKSDIESHQKEIVKRVKELIEEKSS
ncbi:DUF262 domain-containing protein [Desulfosudis oleivorans]|uniref:GmrSD restriction endonucleases N-terminal domain-containing protein n=1 Tax=Desulfosudis oleivorans (strain DSM 6200 / JCM 39069 / Hxd3) TaxID=96561 RepID=A8ZS40_DESOH|nr:DUF262 domain-containing protein [Desulfosudis oleivorans]ABW66058.1 protein of unknown function DUF262 [Desulfosudis oleivorans Hxd3]